MLKGFIQVTRRGPTKASLRAMSSQGLAIDCHTHMYTPKYMDILRKRNVIPRVIMVGDENRLLILPGEDEEATTSVGRKIGKEVKSCLILIIKRMIDLILWFAVLYILYMLHM